MIRRRARLLQAVARRVRVGAHDKQQMRRRSLLKNLTRRVSSQAVGRPTVLEYPGKYCCDTRISGFPFPPALSAGERARAGEGRASCCGT